MSRSFHASQRIQVRVARSLVAVLFCLTIGAVSGCGKITGESRLFSAVSRLLAEQGFVPAAESSTDQGTNPGASGDESNLAANPGFDTAGDQLGSDYVIIEAEDASIVPEPNAVSDANALFSYEDSDGRTNMVRGLHNVPAEFQALARRLGADGGGSINRYNASAVVKNYKRRVRLSGAVFNPNRLDVTFFSAKWCGACRRTKQLLDSENIRYTLRDIDEDPAAKEEVRRVLGSVRIPLIDINGTYVTGYDRKTILRLIKGSS